MTGEQNGTKGTAQDRCREQTLTHAWDIVSRLSVQITESSPFVEDA